MEILFLIVCLLYLIGSILFVYLLAHLCTYSLTND